MGGSIAGIVGISYYCSHLSTSLKCLSSLPLAFSGASSAHAVGMGALLCRDVDHAHDDIPCKSCCAFLHSCAPRAVRMERLDQAGEVISS